jgi:hypothetical protein
VSPQGILTEQGKWYLLEWALNQRASMSGLGLLGLGRFPGLPETAAQKAANIVFPAVSFMGLGQEVTTMPVPDEPPAVPAVVVEAPPSPLRIVGRVLSMAGAGLGAYHGYKRNRNSIGWAFGWSIFGGLMPIFAIPVAVAQGVGKPKAAKA